VSSTDLEPLKAATYTYTLTVGPEGHGTQVTYHGTRHDLGAAWLVITESDGTRIAIPRERVKWLRISAYVPPAPMEPEDALPVLSLPAQDVNVVSMSQSRFNNKQLYTVQHLPTGTMAAGYGKADAFRNLHQQLFTLGYDAKGNPPAVEPEDEVPGSSGVRLPRNLVTRGGVDGA